MLSAVPKKGFQKGDIVEGKICNSGGVREVSLELTLIWVGDNCLIHLGWDEFGCMV